MVNKFHSSEGAVKGTGGKVRFQPVSGSKTGGFYTNKSVSEKVLDDANTYSGSGYGTTATGRPFGGDFSGVERVSKRTVNKQEVKKKKKFTNKDLNLGD